MEKMDKIIIKDLEIYANHGVLKEERELGQKFVVSCVLYLDTRKAASDDDINQTNMFQNNKIFDRTYI